MSKTIRKAKTVATLHGLKALPDEGPGVFSAIVSVFGNVDHQGDRIIAGAFAKSLERWAASGDPIPVIFSHQWDDLEAHVGEVLEAKELGAGDPLLAGTGLEDNGGLLTKFRLDVDDPDEPFARRLAKRLEKRRIKEFSFAYDVIEERRGSDGANELLELDVIEVGPTLKGANPATRLLSAALDGELNAEQVIEALEAVAKRRAETGAKARVNVDFEGSVEAEVEALYDAAFEHFRELDSGDGGFYYLHQEATYPTEDRAIVLVEGWNDPIGEGIFYEVSFERGDDGTVTVADAAEIEVTVEVSRKARVRKNRVRSAIVGKDRGTVAAESNTGKATANAEEPGRANAEEPGAETGSEDASGYDTVLAELDLAEAELS